MAFIRAASLSDIPPGTAIQVELEGEGYALCNVEGRLYAIDGICPHSAGPIGEGGLHGHIMVCPWHGWEFDCRTGHCNVDDNLVQKTFPVRVENGDVLIDIT